MRSVHIKFAILSAIMTVLLIFSPVVGGVAMAHASAATNNNYSYVLYDLQKDSKFNENEYPEKKGDYSLQVIQVAESVDDELFVYVYQPSGKSVDLRATSINISKGYKTLKFINYTLTFVNSHKTLYKYKVDNFKVEDTRLRYYDITSIYRAWNKAYDNETGNDNTISEVPFNVSTIYKLGVEKGEFVVETKPTDTIQVVSKYVGFVRYEDGWKLCRTACDSHFVAFTTDIPIDKLCEADIYYSTQSYSCVWATGLDPDHPLAYAKSETFGEKEDNYAYVTDKADVQFSYTTDGWFNVGTINRDRIARVDDFIKNENIEKMYSCGLFNVAINSSISQVGINNLKQCEWVVRFAETPYSYSPMAANSTRYTIVGDVSILRLEGMSNGEHFNLGVIDNKQSGSQKPINDWTVTVTGAGKDIWRIIKIILAVLACIVLIILVCWIIRIIVKPIKAIDKTVKSIKKSNKKEGDEFNDKK